MTRTNRTLVIYAHPYTGSFNHAVLEATTTALDKANRPYDVIDLYADGFDPRYTVEELALFGEGGTLDPLVTRYQELIKGAARLIVVTPIWWNDLPGMLKGFFDKVMKQKWAYDPTPSGREGAPDPHRADAGAHHLHLTHLVHALPRRQCDGLGIPGRNRQATGHTGASLGQLRPSEPGRRGRRPAPHRPPPEGRPSGGGVSRQ